MLGRSKVQVKRKRRSSALLARLASPRLDVSYNQMWELQLHVPTYQIRQQKYGLTRPRLHMSLSKKFLPLQLYDYTLP